MLEKSNNSQINDDFNNKKFNYLLFQFDESKEIIPDYFSNFNVQVDTNIINETERIIPELQLPKVDTLEIEDTMVDIPQNKLQSILPVYYKII